MKVRLSRVGTAAVAVAAMAVIGFSGGGAAAAAPARPAPSQTAAAVAHRAGVSAARLPGSVIVHKMTVTGVNERVARAHGFKVVVGADGRRRAVPTAAARNPDGTRYASHPHPHPHPHPQDVVEGDCGDSYLWIHPVGGYVSEIETGFDLDQDAVAFYWQVDRSDPYGSDNYSWGGGLGFDSSWSGEWDVHGGGSGWELAGVDSVSDALLWDGDICTSEGATDAEWIF